MEISKATKRKTRLLYDWNTESTATRFQQFQINFDYSEGVLQSFHYYFFFIINNEILKIFVQPSVHSKRLLSILETSPVTRHKLFSVEHFERAQISYQEIGGYARWDCGIFA